MIPAMLSIGLAGLLTALVAGATMVITGPLWRGRPHLGMAYGLAGTAVVAYLSFLATWLAPAAGVVLAWVFLAASIIVLVLRGAWRHWREALPVLLLMVGIAGVYVAILYLWGSPVGAFSLAGQRFVSGSLPIDNLIPYLFGERLASAQSTHALIGDWNGSDRPPLQAGLLLFVRAVATPIAGPASGAFGASVVAQLLWIPAVFALLRALGTPKRSAVIAVLMVAAAGTTMLNTLFTWPKMMSAALVLTSAVFLVDAIRRPPGFNRSFALGVTSFVFAMLAHGAAVFALPFVVVLGVMSYRGQSPRRVLGGTALAVAVGVVVYLPWLFYGMFADPPGDRLIKWHLAGVLSPADDRPLLDTVIAAYRALSPGDWLAGRLANLQVAFDANIFTGIGCFCPGDVAARRSAEFLLTTVALGFAAPAIVIVLALIAIRVVRTRSLRLQDRTFLLLVAAAVLCIVFWCILMFVPGSAVIHQGSQLWILVLLAAPIAWLATRHRAAALVVAMAQFAVTLVFYVPMYGAHSLSPGAIPVAVGGLVLCGLGVALVGRSVRPSGKLGTS